MATRGSFSNTARLVVARVWPVWPEWLAHVRAARGPSCAVDEERTSPQPRGRRTKSPELKQARRGVPGLPEDVPVRPPVRAAEAARGELLVHRVDGGHLLRAERPPRPGWEAVK